jgi:pimeloyl-ACP methyl ester carboxylesterase
MRTKLVLLLIVGLSGSFVFLVTSTGIGQSYTKEDISWTNGDVKLQGDLYLPRTDGPHPCAVFIHGSGTLSRFGRSGSMFREHAERLSAQGLALLIYDKRGAGRSTGDWKTATLDDLCTDSLGAVDALRKRKDIDQKRIGLFGSSQGGWITLLAAKKDSKLAFVVTLSGPTITPAEQGHYITEASLRKKGHAEEDIQAALKLDRQITEVYRKNLGWEAAKAAIDEAKGEKWFADAALGIQSEDSWNWKWYRDLPFDLDPMPLLRDLTIPLLAVHGENDMLVPSDRSTEMINQLKNEGKNFSTIVIPGVGHGINAGKGRIWEGPDEYWSKLNQWLQQQSIIGGLGDKK